ncbi:glycosyltransferase family 2 protein [Nigerium massiliense]|uniref:glycosyltransferase family 2 protein n=1 Tax=Nigerium massiliense TaxID=1522317 RepID=UPI000693CF12|nr:glycosyltransferase family A protein [Nigerium massiliense]
MAPKVSVVVPSYNSAAFIDEAIRSILNQTFGDFELIVSDHSSTDGTWERLQAYADDPRVRLLRTEPGGGAPANWKRVSAEASGEYLKLVCGDDVIAPTLLAEQVAPMEEDDTVVMVSCKRSLIDARGAELVAGRGLGGLRGTVPGPSAARRSVICGTNIFGEPGCVLYRRSAFTKAGGWDAEDPYVIDQATACNVLMLGRYHALDRVLASFRISAQQWSVNLAQKQADQVVSFHHRLARTNPGLLSRADLLRGDAMARGMAVGRRLTYAYLGRKLHAADDAGRPSSSAKVDS